MLAEIEKARVRELVKSLLDDPEARKKASRELLEFGWKAVPALEEARWNSMVPLTLFAEKILAEMPLEAWARDGEYVRVKDGAVMVWVPPGEIPMPNWAIGAGYSRRRVRIDGFFVDRFCVTNRMFAKYLEENGGPKAPFHDTYPERSYVHLDGGHWVSPDGLGNHPVWNGEAWRYDEYAEWAGALLPTSAQWERAAGAGDGRRFPWGNQPCTPLFAQIKEYPLEDTVPVWWFEKGDSPFGCRQMTGNVLEYSLDSVHEDLDVMFDEKGGNPFGFRLPWYVYRMLKGGGVDEGEDAYPIRSYEIMCGG